MQVFLPYPDLQKSVCCLDPKRLGNQIYRECITLLHGGWKNHPVARMWDGHHVALATYALYGLRELHKRGCNYFDRPWAVEIQKKAYDGDIMLPHWFGDEQLHASHRAVLLYKNIEWYGQLGWMEEPAILGKNGRLPYFWPE